ncbi:sphingosine kinase [Sporothrix brasiliensis 5110]|uniref:Sphingosine kinase n=1 Tax=Sporothrix brasiliensis 5110 TaxID=1398154 RepID=A0A0C2FN86_9PEZI|nr:sphingosine kinase [Sporothrix brasiliensis 5110]KIH92488.1 sphingosine kinase [Sporothrix brasiliensis 5110]
MSSDTATAAEAQVSSAGANGDAVNGAASGAANGIHGTANGVSSTAVDPSDIPQAPPVPPTPSPPPTARTAKRQSHVVSFDKTLENTLKLQTHDFDIQDNDLVVVDKEKRKKNRHTCMSSSAADYRLSIPLYNVLWASVSDDNRRLVIDYADVASKTRIRPAKFTVSLEPSGPDWPTPAEVAAWAELLRNRAYGDVPQRRRAYVLVNPHAGPGGAMKKWEHEARPLLDAARLSLTVVTTAYSGQAIELCTALDIDAYDMVLACSGDGLPHECFNGLGKRPDARRALEKIAVAHVPCGSGNAMACNLYGSHHVSVAALAIVKGVVAPLDLASITYGETRLLSFLSQAVGVMAEVDLATENLRWMGSARFTWGFIERLLARKVYPCDLAVKVEIEHKDDVKAHYSRHQAPAKGSRTTGKSTGTSTTKAAGKTSAAAAAASSAAASSATTTVAAADADAGAASGSGGDTSDQSLPPLQFGTVNDPLPDDWETIPEDKMGNFFCGNMAYMAPDTSFFAAALMADGLMDLITIDGDISPAKSLGMLLTVEDNRLFDNPLVRYRKISGFRLTPRNQKDGYISIDGERIPFSPFQAEVHKGLGRVIAKRATPGYEAPGPLNWDKMAPVERIMA